MLPQSPGPHSARGALRGSQPHPTKDGSLVLRAITRSKQPCTRVAGIRSPLTSLAHALARPAAERHQSTLVYLQPNAMASPSASTASSTTGFAASGFLCLPQARRPADAEQGLSLPHRPPHPVYLCLNRGVHEALRGQVAGVHLSASLLGNLASWARIATLAVMSTYYPRAWVKSLRGFCVHNIPDGNKVSREYV